MSRTKKSLIAVVLFFLAVSLLALGAGLLRAPQTADAVTFFGEKKVEDLRKADPAAIAKQEKYSSRDYGIVTSVKNQSNDPLCWAYATVAACETSILREGLEGADAATLDLDERNLGWWANNPRTDEFHLIDGDVPAGNGLYSTGGAMEVAGKTFLQWMGPSVQAARDETAIKNAPPSPYLLEGMYTFDYSVENVKAAVAKYGAVSCSYYFYHGAKIYDYLNNAGEAKINPHSSIIVGWDDTVPADKYRPKASSRSGGWIVKNSWGTQNIEGYFYLSYDSQIYDVRAFDCTEASEFDHQYFYNGVIKQGVSKMTGTKDGVKAAAVYQARGGSDTTLEKLTAVNVGVGGKDVGVTVSVYRQPKVDFKNLYWSETDPERGELCTSERFTGVGEGYHTFRLKEPVPLENGETFSVVVRAQNGAGDASLYFTEDTKSDNDMTFLFANGIWRNGKRSGVAAHIRAYTAEVERPSPLPGEKTAEALRSADPAAIAALETYDSREYGIVTPVRNQYDKNICWSFGTLAASEVSILREGLAGADVGTLHFDDRALAWQSLNPVPDEYGLVSSDMPALGYWNTGNYVSSAGKAMLRWLGPVKKGNGSEADVRAEHPRLYTLENMIPVPMSGEDGIENAKYAIARYGAIAASYFTGSMNNSTVYYNSNGQNSGGHSIAVVGWDDTIAAEQFAGSTPARNGAWIVKNSWGEMAGKNGYFYLSYDSYLWDAWAFDFTDADAYDHQYFYNGSLQLGYKSCEAEKAGAIYRAAETEPQRQELIAAVGIGAAGEGVTATITVYKLTEANFGTPRSAENLPDSGKPVSVTVKKLEADGFQTVRLDEPVPLDPYDIFSVVVELKSSAGTPKFLTMLDPSENDMTFLYQNGAWSNSRTRDKVYYAPYADILHIRAYTVDTVRTEPLPVRDLKSADVAVAAGEYRYNGGEIAPEVTVTLDGKVLRAGTDYTLRYENNVFASDEAAAIVAGIAPYTGEKRVTFTIEKAQEPPELAPFGKIELTEEMKTLADVELPDGWRWAEPETAVSPGKMTAQCEYIGTDAENYAVRTRTAELEFTQKETPGEGGGTGGETEPDTGGETEPDTGGETDPGTGGETDPGTGGETDPGTGGDKEEAEGGNAEEEPAEGADGGGTRRGGGLSPAAIAGIAAGCAAGAGLLALTVVLVRRRRL